jgi:uncharacterized protein with ATP-grasp and redox domains
VGILRFLQENSPCPETDPLRRALKISLAGNMLDFSGLGRGDIQEEVVRLLQASPARDDGELLASALEKTDSVMLVTGRAGEIVLDRPLAEAIAAMGKKVYLVVSAKPIFLMATEKDAENAAYPGKVEVVNPGTAMYGLVQERASSEVRGLLSEVGMVIVKGATHFATMTPQRDLFFILSAREREIAARLGIPLGSGAIVKMPAAG